MALNIKDIPMAFLSMCSFNCLICSQQLASIDHQFSVGCDRFVTDISNAIVARISCMYDAQAKADLQSRMRVAQPTKRVLGTTDIREFLGPSNLVPDEGTYLYIPF